MSEEMSITQDERTLAGLAHGSILLGIFTSGVGGIIAALVIWLLQREKSAYAARQSLQALIYQALTFILTMLAWCCWGVLWTAMIFVPLSANPGAYDVAPPPGLWLGMFFMIIPIGIWGLTIVYALYGAVRCLSGRDFDYVIIGNWLGD